MKGTPGWLQGVRTGVRKGRQDCAMWEETLALRCHPRVGTSLDSVPNTSPWSGSGRGRED